MDKVGSSYVPEPINEPKFRFEIKPPIAIFFWFGQQKKTSLMEWNSSNWEESYLY